MEQLTDKQHQEEFQKMFSGKISNPKVFPKTYEFQRKLYLYEHMRKNAGAPITEFIDLTGENP